MLVNCICNDVQAIANEEIQNRLSKFIKLTGPDTNLVKGECYFVFALEEWEEGLVIYLHTIKESKFPYPYPIEFFEVIDPSFSIDWSICFEDVRKGKKIKRISFKEWFADDSFYEHLVEEEPSVVEIYERYRQSYTIRGQRN